MMAVRQKVREVEEKLEAMCSNMYVIEPGRKREALDAIEPEECVDRVRI